MIKAITTFSQFLRKGVLNSLLLVIAISFLPINVLPELVNLLADEKIEYSIAFPTGMEEEENKEKKDKDDFLQKSLNLAFSPFLFKTIGNKGFFTLNSGYFGINLPPPKIS